VAAVCDVDIEGHGAGTLKKYKEITSGVPRFQDFRKMFDKHAGDMDAVAISTPDHTHAVIAKAAMELGKHVYCEKPLAHSVHELRTLAKVQRAHPKLVTQMGNQGHSSGSIRTFVEWIRDGAIGKVHTIHAGCDRVHSAIGQLDKRDEEPAVPGSLDWDLWLGPAAQRPYHPMYLPGRWRDWSPFGSGTIGDWTCHVVDPVFWALDLGLPSVIQAEAEGYDPIKHRDTFPAGVRVRFEFAAKGERGPVTMYWYSGNRGIPRPEGLEEGRKSPTTGAVVLGDKGGITYGSHGAGGVRMYPEASMRAYQEKGLPKETIPRVRGHQQDWLDGIKEGRKAGSDFAEYGAALTEIACLGNIATFRLGQELRYDGAAARFTNDNEANDLLNPPARKGWGV
jgi:predicted dehydrogenase